MPIYSLAEINAMSQAEFSLALGAIFEETPLIAERTWQKRPFPNLTELHHQMMRVVRSMSPEEQLALIQAHPDLGSKVKMAEASVREQMGAGLDRLKPEEYERFLALNQAYRSKFGFPFIIAVKNSNKDDILKTFSQRLQNLPTVEREQALLEIFRIAWFRLTDKVQDPSGALP